MKELFTKKTTWLGIVMVAYGGYQIFTGDAENGIKTVEQGLALIFIRHALIPGR